MDLIAHDGDVLGFIYIVDYICGPLGSYLPLYKMFLLYLIFIFCLKFNMAITDDV